MNRRQAITAGVAGAGTLILPEAAKAARRHMGPRFDAQLHTHHRGLFVHASGPLGRWTWDVDYGYVAVAIVQGRVKGHGMSTRVDRGDRRWHAPQVTADNVDHRFHHGPAIAHGVLLIPDGRSAYSYAWSVPVELVAR